MALPRRALGHGVYDCRNRSTVTAGPRFMEVGVVTQVHPSYFTLRRRRSIKMLSKQRPWQSMLMRASVLSSRSVKSSRVNWLPWSVVNISGMRGSTSLWSAFIFTRLSWPVLGWLSVMQSERQPSAATFCASAGGFGLPVFFGFDFFPGDTLA